MPLRERNSFALRQLLHPGCVNRTNFSVAVFIRASRMWERGNGRLLPRSFERQGDARALAFIDDRGYAGDIILTNSHTSIFTRMKLIGTPASPFTRKARVVLAEKRIEYDFIVNSPHDAATTVTDYNPLGKIPVLVLDDATTIFDSRVIVEYLDNASPVTKLLPDDTRHRIQTRRWEALADGCTDACV